MSPLVFPKEGPPIPFHDVSKLQEARDAPIPQQAVSTFVDTAMRVMVKEIQQVQAQSSSYPHYNPY